MSLLPSYTPAVLALADGTIFKGQSIGADGVTSGEVVFNTAMSGYQEILTDPSYARQIVTLTYPHVGNTGCNSIDVESARVQAAGLVIRDLPLLASSWRSEESLDAYLRRHGVVAIADVDMAVLQVDVRVADAGVRDCHEDFRALRGGNVGGDFLERLAVGDDGLALHGRTSSADLMLR